MKLCNYKNYRFWGKILGNPKNYYVLEADLKKEELNDRQNVGIMHIFIFD